MEREDRQVIELLKEIASLRQDIDLHRVVGLNSDAIRQSRLSDSFFGHIQALAHHSIALRICKIFEAPTGRFELNSILGAIANLPEKTVSLDALATLKSFADRHGNRETSDDPREVLEATFHQFLQGNAYELARFRTFRNKVAAHSEAEIRNATLPSHAVFEIFYGFSYDSYAVMRRAFYGVVPALIHRRVATGLCDLFSSAGISKPQLSFPPDE